jgi:hypothetical protein
MEEPENIYYSTPVDEYWLVNPPKEVYEAVLATMKGLSYISSIDGYSRGDDPGEFRETIIATGKLRFITKDAPLGLYVEVDPRNDGTRLFLEIYFIKPRGFLLRVFAKNILRKKCREIENTIFNMLRPKTKVFNSSKSQ